jgi:hypothetical protein
MQAFDRRCGTDGVRRGNPEQRRALHHQERAKTLAAREHRVAHRGKEAWRPEPLAFKRRIAEDFRKRSLDPRGGLSKPAVEDSILIVCHRHGPGGLA